MLRIIIIFTFLFVLVTAVGRAVISFDEPPIVPTGSVSTEKKLKNFMNIYLEAHKDTRLLTPLFSANAEIIGIRNGELTKFTKSEFLKRAKNVTRSSNESDNAYCILNFNQNTAAVYATVHVNDQCFTDYLILTKIENEWQITHKSFSDDCNTKP